MISFHSHQLGSVHNLCDLSSTAETSKADQTSYSLSLTGNTTPLVWWTNESLLRLSHFLVLCLPPLNLLLGYLSFWFIFFDLFLLSLSLTIHLFCLVSFDVRVGLLESSHTSSSSRLRSEFFSPTGKTDRWANGTGLPLPWTADYPSESSLVCQPPLTSPVEVHCRVNACLLRALWGNTF